MQAIQSATITNALVLGKEKELGQLAIGYIADIVGADEDPTQNIQAMGTIVIVMKEGKVYKD